MRHCVFLAALAFLSEVKSTAQLRSRDETPVPWQDVFVIPVHDSGNRKFLLPRQHWRPSLCILVAVVMIVVVQEFAQARSNFLIEGFAEAVVPTRNMAREPCRNK